LEGDVSHVKIGEVPEDEFFYELYGKRGEKRPLETE